MHINGYVDKFCDNYPIHRKGRILGSVTTSLVPVRKEEPQ